MAVLPTYPFSYTQLLTLLKGRERKHLSFGRNLTLNRRGDIIYIDSYSTPIVEVRPDNTIRIAAYGISSTTQRHANKLKLDQATSLHLCGWDINMGTVSFPAVIKNGRHVIPENANEVLTEVRNTVVDFLLSNYPEYDYFSLYLLVNQHQNIAQLRFCDNPSSALSRSIFPFRPKKGKLLREKILKSLRCLPFGYLYLDLSLNDLSPIEKLVILSKQAA